MPDVPGRSEVLLALADNLDEFDKDERDLVIVSMLTSAHVMHGAASEPAAAIETRYGGMLSREARKELKNLRADIEEARKEITEAEEPSIYEVCLEGFDVMDEDQPLPTRRTQTGPQRAMLVWEREEVQEMPSGCRRRPLRPRIALP